MKFSEKMSELDKILRKLEGESLPIEEAMNDFERGVALVKECGEYLENAKQRITILTEKGEKEVDRNSFAKGE